MKKIEVIIRPEKLEELREALDAINLSSMTVTEVKGRGSQKGILLEWRVGEYRVEFMPKIKVELVVDNNKVETVLRVIRQVCSTGSVGDGKVFILPVENCIRLSSWQQGTEAIQ